MRLFCRAKDSHICSTKNMFFVIFAFENLKKCELTMLISINGLQSAEKPAELSARSVDSDQPWNIQQCAYRRYTSSPI